jgi:chromosome segregation ATPase
LEQSQADSEQTQTDLEIFKSEYKKLEEILTKTNEELSFYKNENLDSMMKKEITIINQSAEMDKISQKNKEISEKYEISENLRKSQKESLEELKKSLQMMEDEMSDAAGSYNNQLMIAEGKTKENEGLQNQILELTESLLAAETEHKGHIKEIERLTDSMTESLRITVSLESTIEESKLKITELEEEVARVTELNNELSMSNEKQEALLTLSDAKIVEVQEEMKDLVKSLVVLEASKEEESAESQSHIEKLVNEVHEKDASYNSLKDENFALQSTLQMEKMKCLELESKIAQIETDSILCVEEAAETTEGMGEGVGGSEGDEVSSLRSQLDAAQQVIDQYNTIDSQKSSLLNEIEGLQVSKRELQEHLSELETQLSTAVVTALSNEAAAKTEIDTHQYETFRLLSEIQGLQVVVEQQTEEIVYLQSQSQSTTGSPRSPRGSFVTSRLLSTDDVIEDARPDLPVQNGLILSDDILTDIDIEIVNKNEIEAAGQAQSESVKIEIELLNQQIQGQNQQIQDQNQRIQSLSEQVQEASSLLEGKNKELLTATAALAASEAQTSSLLLQIEAQRLEYLEKDDLISQVLDGKKTLEEEIKRFLGGREKREEMLWPTNTDCVVLVLNN